MLFMNVKLPEAPQDMTQLQAMAERACALLKVMANPDRLVLLCRLSQGELCVSDLEAELGIQQPTLSQQLGILRTEGLVDTRREGKHIYYALASDDAAAVMQVLHARLCQATTSKRSRKIATPGSPPRKAQP